MSTTLIRQKLHHYIETAKEKKLKAIFTMVEEEIKEPDNRWNDKEFVAELERRESAFMEGKTTAYTLDETITRARKALKNSKKR